MSIELQAEKTVHAVEPMTETLFRPGRDYRIGTRTGQRMVAFFEDRLVVQGNGPCPQLPAAEMLTACDPSADPRLYLGTLGNEVYVGRLLSEAPDLAGGLALVGLRSLFGELEEAQFQLAGYALHLLRWVGEHRYCGRCAAPMDLAEGDRALVCPTCRTPLYPRIAPAVIVAITSGRRLLLARSGRFPGRRMFSVIAGYVEPGETLEECVRREVHEEVGLRVRRIRYFGSQSWPFSGSLMVGFTAEHANGAIQVDGREILEADWFVPERLPEIPGRISIARRLIDWFVETYT